MLAMYKINYLASEGRRQNNLLKDYWNNTSKRWGPKLREIVTENIKDRFEKYFKD